MSQEEGRLSDQIMVTTRSTTGLEAKVIDLSLEADQIRLRKARVSHVAKKVTGSVIVQTEDTKMVVNKQ